MRTSLFAFAILVGLSVSVAAQQCTTQVAVNAFDARTKDFLHGLTSADLEAVAGRNQLEITSVRPVFRNRVLVLLDVSGRPGQEVLDTAADLVSEAPDGMPVAFGLFASHAAFTRGFIKSSEALSAAVHQLTANANSLGDRNDLPRALRQALDLFGPHQPGDTILLVSNGRQHESRHAIQQLRKEFRRSGTRLELLMGLMPSGSGRANDVSLLFAGWALAQNVSDDLIRLANSTGGALMGFMNSDWEQVASSGYMLSIVTPADMTGPQPWTLRIHDAGNDVPPAELFYPEQLAPCTAPMVAAFPAETKPRP
jgi:hypothetical protein